MENSLRVNRNLEIAGNELKFRATASGGPGGQHVNTSNTRVELTFSIAKSKSLGPRQKTRLIEKFGPEIRIVASNRRSQYQNRESAREKLAAKLAAGLEIPKSRRPTKRTRGSIERRLQSKKKRSDVKKNRRRPTDD